MTVQRPSVSILVPWSGDACTPALVSALKQRGDNIEIIALCDDAMPAPSDPRLRFERVAPGADPLGAGLGAARGALCIVADAEADWAPGEAAARAALFPEPSAALMMILPRTGASGAAPCARAWAGGRAAGLLFRDGAPPPLSALCAPTAIWRAAKATGAAGRWGAALLTLRAEAAGARVEAPFGPFPADESPAPMDGGLEGARAALRLAAPLLTPDERVWAEIRCLGPALMDLAPGDARRLGWRGLRAGGVRRAALALLTAHGAAGAQMPG